NSAAVHRVLNTVCTSIKVSAVVRGNIVDI
ncbi:MAG: hypothetical protein ACI8SZ_002418, partial [Colwellia sp.]